LQPDWIMHGFSLTMKWLVVENFQSQHNENCMLLLLS